MDMYIHVSFAVQELLQLDFKSMAVRLLPNCRKRYEDPLVENRRVGHRR